MQKRLFCLWVVLLFFQNANAQFGTNPKIITSSDQSNAITGAKKFTTCDYDADGRLDLVAISATGATGFRSDGFGSFRPQELLISEDLTSVPVGFFGAQFLDLDADGLPDLAVGKSWRRNLGSGSFAAQQTVFEKNVALIFDADGDNLPDALLVDATAIFWQRNLGSGQFGASQVLKNANNPLIFKIFDFDGDGKTDFLARQNDGCFWYKNLGGGNFDAVQLFSAVPENLVTADLDSDGKTELIYNVGANIEWQEFDAAGLPTPVQTISTKFKTGRGFALGDVTADGFPDLLFGELTTGFSGGYFKFNAAMGVFSTSPKEAIPGFFPDFGLLEIADLDGDGNNDFCTATANQFQMCWFRQISPGVFSLYQFFQVGLNIPKTIVSLDYDADGDLDLVASGQEPSNSAITTATLVVNLGNGNYEKRAYPGGGTQGFNGDLDGDGLKDRAFYGGNDSIYWQKFLGTNFWGARKSLPGLLTSCKQVAGGDLDNDGDLDLFAANGTDAVSVNARFYWFENDGAGNFTPHLLETDLQLCSSAFPLDVNEDGWLDMVLYFFNGSPKVYKNLGGGQFAAPDTFFPLGVPSPSNVNQSILTDLDADGRTDYVYVTKMWGDQKIAWYRNLGPAGFSGERVLATWSTNASWATNYFTVFDGTGDGLPDIVISDNYWGKLRFIRGVGNGAFSAMTVIYDETQPFNYGNFFAVAPHDVNGDGKLDIVFGKRSLQQALPNYLMWLENVAPEPQPSILVLNQEFLCENNGTPADPSDDIKVLKMTINNPTAAGVGQYYLTNTVNALPLDTFNYNQSAFYRWQPGSASDDIQQIIEIHDLETPDISKIIFAETIGTCSFDAPVSMTLSQEDFYCDPNSTPNNPADDIVRFQFAVHLNNVPTASPGFFIASNMGVVKSQLLNLPNGQGVYNKWNRYSMPVGSGNIPQKVILTLHDKLDMSIVREIVFDNPCNPSVPLSATLSGGGEVCAGESSVLAISFTGEAPYTFTLAQNGVLMPPITTAQNVFLIEVVVLQNAVFTLQNVTNAQGAGLVSGAANIFVFPVPVAAIIGADTICLGETATLAASGGIKFNWNTGDETPQITVTPTETTAFLVTVSDANDCSDTELWTVVVKNCSSGIFTARDPQDDHFRVFPNPISESHRLQILLENDFFGTIKFEILSLDGRILETFFEEKTAQQLNVGRVLKPSNVSGGAAFFVRVSDGKTSATRLVLRF